ncbi:MAG: hypothetical protein AAFO69_07770 [Bacteroidota bacterium]
MNDLSNKTSTYFWFNPDADRYEAGSMTKFEAAKALGQNQVGFSLILKLENPLDEAVIQRLIAELNIAREDLFQMAS